MKSAEEVGAAVLERFNRHNDELRTQGAALRQAIRAISEVNPDLAAYAIRARLKVAELGRDIPSLRTVQIHLQAIRAERRRCTLD